MLLPRLKPQRWISYLILLMLLSLWLSSCAATPKPIIEPVEWPVFPALSQEFYLKAPPADVKKLLNHEIDWQGAATKMDNRLKVLQH
jgi:hypothetical protein